MKKLLLSSILFIVSFSINLFSQNSNIEPVDLGNGVMAPNDFPRYINTGNEQQDVDRYVKAKTNWIRENKLLYDSLMAVVNSTTINNSENIYNNIAISNNSSNNEIVQNDSERPKVFYECINKCVAVGNHFEISEVNLAKLDSESQNYIRENPNYFTIIK